LLDGYKKFNEADHGDYFDHTQVWTLLALLEWLVWIVERMARQAYVEHALSAVSSPDQSSTIDSTSTQKDNQEADVLSLVTHDFPRRLLTQSIVKAVKMCNWLQRINQSKEQAKDMINRFHLQETLKSGAPPNRRPESESWHLADKLRLAQMRMTEVLLNSAVDLSGLGRLLKQYKAEDASDQEKAGGSRWWTVLNTGDRSRMAKVLVEGHCIKTAVLLFCPREGEAGEAVEEEEEGGRDILTKARLDVNAKRLLCLSCQSQTQAQLEFDQKCICGSDAWWSISSR
jgi:hypothetical protein